MKHVDTETFLDRVRDLPLDVKMKHRRAEMMILHDALFPGVPQLSYQNRYHLPDARRFPFHEYEFRDPFPRVAYWVDQFDGTRWLVDRPRCGMPIEQEIEIERFIGPFYERGQALVFWREQNGDRAFTLILDYKLYQSIHGAIWAWGWPLFGTVFHSGYFDYAFYRKEEMNGSLSH